MTRFSADDLAALDGFWKPQARAVTSPEDPQNRGVSWFSGAHAGIQVTPEIAMEVSTVWACIEVIAKSIAAQPWNMYERLPNGDRDLLFNDQVGYLLNCRPNPEMNAISLREAMAAAALSWGNAYAEIEWDRSNRPVAIWPLAPDRVQPLRAEDGRLVFRVYNYLTAPTYLESENVLHVHGVGLTGLLGNNILQQASHTIALAIAAERFAENYFGNNTQIGGVLTYPNKLDDNAFERLKKEWNETHSGPNRSHRPAILEQGMKWEERASDSNGAQVIPSRQNQVFEICRWFGVPPHKVGELSRSTNNNIEHQGLEFVRDACTPWARRFEQEVDYKLLDTRGRPRFSKIDLEPLSQGDAVSRMTYYRGMAAIGVYCPNDILKMEGKNTIGPVGDIRFVNGANTRLEDVGKNFGAQPSSASSTGEGGSNGDPALVQNTFRALFHSLYDRADKRRSARKADLERAQKEGDDIATAMDVFAQQQEGFLHDNLRQPCSTLSTITQGDVFAVALAAGRRVVTGELSPSAAADEVIDSAFGDPA